MQTQIVQDHRLFNIWVSHTKRKGQNSSFQLLLVYAVSRISEARY